MPIKLCLYSSYQIGWLKYEKELTGLPCTDNVFAAGNRLSYTNWFLFQFHRDLCQIDAIQLSLLVQFHFVPDYLETGQHSVWLCTIRIPSEY